MTDFHIHIGQFNTVYYYADRVFYALKANGIDEVWFSSTTSCLYCKESQAAKKDKAIHKNAPTAVALYEGVRDEIKNALIAAAEIEIKAHALYWVVPEIHFSKSVSVNRVMCEIPYDGFKIHPRAQNWNLSYKKNFLLLKEIFSYAENYDKLVLIHSDENYPPTLFEELIVLYPNANVQFAHCRPLAETLYMLRTYPNTVCDTAMASEENIKKLKQAGLSARIRYGSDFPITHYRSENPKTDPTCKELTDILKRTKCF